MADFDFLDGFDTGGDWGFTGVSEKPSDKSVSDSKATEQVVKQTSESDLSDGFSETPVKPQSPPVSKPSKKSKSAILLFIFRRPLIFYFCVFFSC